MTMKKIAIGSDHAGFELKQAIKHYFSAKIQFFDVGTHVNKSCDYPDYAHEVCRMVNTGEAECGILICGSGNGMTIAANKHNNIRCALAWKNELAALARQHNNANVLSLPARFISEAEAFGIVEAFLNAEFEGGRHERRVAKVSVF